MVNDVRDMVMKGVSMVRLRHKCRFGANREETIRTLGLVSEGDKVPSQGQMLFIHK
jgi:hypothetical protein